MKTQFLNPLIFLILWITFCGNNWREDFTGSKDTSAGDLVIWAHLIYDSVAFQTVHLHIPFNFLNGILGGCFDHIEFQNRPYRGIPQGRAVPGYFNKDCIGENNS